MKTRSFLSILALVLLFASGVAWVSRASAQTSAPRPPGPIERMVLGTAPDGTSTSKKPGAEPTVLSGPDIGIRVIGIRNGQVFGTLVVRVDGKWAAVQTMAPITNAAR